MSYLINNEQKINDIIFANRNKNYGAYAIRSTYGNTLVKSIAIMAFGFTSIMGSAYYYTHRNNPNNQGLAGQIEFNDSTITTVVKLDEPMDMKKEEKVEKIEAAQQQQKTTTETTTSTKVADSTSIVTNTAATTPINTGAITSSVTNNDGGSTPSNGTNTAIANNTTGKSDGETRQTFEVDSNPEFEGGLAALYRFVGSKLKYPAVALGDGKEGTVFVKFVVDENGKVGNLNLLNSAGYGMDEEALRVVGLIPNFKTPAKIKGVPVKVYYQLPIKYRLRS